MSRDLHHLLADAAVRREAARQTQLDQVTAALDDHTAERAERYGLEVRDDRWVVITADSFVEERREYRCQRAVEAVTAAGGVAVLTIVARREVPEGGTSRVERIHPAALARFPDPEDNPC